jgi:diacylglycerol kinase (ATP)
VHGPARPLDLIDARGGGRVVRGVEGASAGFLALARARYHARNSADTRAAVRAGVAALARFHPLEVWLTHDGHGEDLWLAQLFVANIACFGTGLRVAPWADPRDGLLEVVALEAAGRRSVPVMLGRLRRGRGARCHGIHVWRAREVLVATRGASPVMVDTDDMGTGPVALAALPGALRLVAPGP